MTRGGLVIISILLLFYLSISTSSLDLTSMDVLTANVVRSGDRLPLPETLAPPQTPELIPSELSRGERTSQPSSYPTTVIHSSLPQPEVAKTPVTGIEPLTSSCTLIAVSWDKSTAVVGDTAQITVTSKHCPVNTPVVLTIADYDALFDDTLASYQIFLNQDSASMTWTLSDISSAFTEFLEGKELELYVVASLITDGRTPLTSPATPAPSVRRGSSVTGNAVDAQISSAPIPLSIQPPKFGDYISPLSPSVRSSTLLVRQAESGNPPNPPIIQAGISLGKNQVFIKNNNVFAITNHLASIPLSFEPCEYFPNDNDIRLQDAITTTTIPTQIQPTRYYQKDYPTCAKGSVMFAVAHVQVSLAPGEEKIYDIIRSTSNPGNFVYASEVQSFLNSGSFKSVSTDMFGREYVADIPLNNLQLVVNG